MLFVKGATLGLFVLIVLGLVIYLLSRNSGGPSKHVSVDDQLIQRNRDWIRFIASYKKDAKKPELSLIMRMLADIKTQGLAPPEGMPDMSENLAAQETAAVSDSGMEYEEELAAVAQTSAEMPPVVVRHRTEIDNASLLLYFGAFLFVASIGLFIVFGGANGAVRTIAVLLLMAGLYGSGVWLFKNRPKLEQAGIAFAGIGMTIAPLAGVAAYNYIFAQTNAPLVWFLTSFMCLGMYVHALIVLRRPLISYLLIFTFLSLFESSISLVAVPIYYFGWGMALVGIITAVVSRIKGFWPEMYESSHVSSALLIPISLLISVALVAQHGVAQLGVSLLFAALFYGFEAFNTTASEQESSAIASHLFTLAAVGCLSFALRSSWKMVAINLLIVNLIQLAYIVMVPQKSRLQRNFASVLLAATGVTAAIAFNSPGVLVASLAALVAASVIIWKRQERIDSYVLAVVAWMLLPLAYGQIYLVPRMDVGLQAYLLLAALLAQLGVFLLHKEKTNQSLWLAASQQMYILSALAVLVAGFFATSPVVSILLAIAVCGSMILLAEEQKDVDWATFSGLAIAAPLVRAIDTPNPLLVISIAALMVNIGLALRYRNEINRWLSTILWLIVPLTLGNAAIGGAWQSQHYAWAYFVVALVLILSRTIARGELLLAKHVPMASYARSASLSYVLGYSFALILAVVFGLSAANAQLHATVMLTLTAGTVWVLAYYIEKRSDLYCLLPFFAQAILWSALRPAHHTPLLTLYLLSSTALAALSYFIYGDPADMKKYRLSIQHYVRSGALITACITPLAYLTTNELVWAMPVGLFVLGSLIYYDSRQSTQDRRELAGGIMTSAILWFMVFAGVHEFQAYTHVVVGLLAFYAYWRAQRGEIERSDQYLMLMLATATIPLVFQALSGTSGGLYGWWLLLEQIGFMLVGMSIQKKFVTRWGLYVALGAVLYQLRGLGWAALIVLAMFIIGVAIHKLQKNNPEN